MFAPPRRCINNNLVPIRGGRRKGVAGGGGGGGISMVASTTTATGSATVHRSAASSSSRGLLQSSRTTLHPSMSSHSLLISDMREQPSLYPVKVPTGITQRHGSISSAETNLQGTIGINRYYHPPRRMLSDRTLLLTERSSKVGRSRKREDIDRIEAQQQRSVRPRLQPCHKFQQPLRRSQTMDNNNEHLIRRAAGNSGARRRRHSLVTTTTQREVSSTVQLSNVVELQQRVDYLTRQLGIKQQIIDGLLKDNAQLREKMKEYDEKSRSRPFNVHYMNDISTVPPPPPPVGQHQQQQSPSPRIHPASVLQEPSRIDVLSSGCSPFPFKVATPSPPPTTASCSPIIGLESISLEGRDSMMFDRPMHIRESIEQLHTSLQYATSTLHD